MLTVSEVPPGGRMGNLQGVKAPVDLLRQPLRLSRLR
jgi:hypothetical protein